MTKIDTSAWDIFTAADRLAWAITDRRRRKDARGHEAAVIALELEDAIAHATCTVERVKESGADMPAVWHAVGVLNATHSPAIVA